MMVSQGVVSVGAASSAPPPGSKGSTAEPGGSGKTDAAPNADPPGGDGTGGGAAEGGHEVGYAWWDPRGWSWPSPDSFLNALNTPSSEVPNVAGNEQIDANAMIEKRVESGAPGGLSNADNVGGTTATKDQNFGQRMGQVGSTLGREFPVFAAGIALELGSLFTGPEDVILLGILKAKGLVIKAVGPGAKKALRIVTQAEKEVVGPELDAIEAQYKAARNAPGNAGLGNAPKAGAPSPIPGSYVDRIQTIDMTSAPGSAVNAAGFSRNGPWFWRQMLKKYPEMFSDANKAAIRAGRSPIVDDAWIKYNPTHQSIAGDKLIHHHIDQGAIASGLPETIHQALHGALHPGT